MKKPIFLIPFSLIVLVSIATFISSGCSKPNPVAIDESTILNDRVRIINADITKEWIDTGKFVQPNKQIMVNCNQEPCVLAVDDCTFEVPMETDKNHFTSIYFTVSKPNNPNHTCLLSREGKISVKLSDRSTATTSKVGILIDNIDEQGKAYLKKYDDFSITTYVEFILLGGLLCVFSYYLAYILGSRFFSRKKDPLGLRK